MVFLELREKWEGNQPAWEERVRPRYLGTGVESHSRDLEAAGRRQVEQGQVAQSQLCGGSQRPVGYT